jgi:chemotaxis methyl-accepting protein methylase
MANAEGVDLARYDDRFLEVTLRKRIEATASGSSAAYVARLADEPAERTSLLDALSVTYSEFYREPLAWAVLRELVVPHIVHTRRRDGNGEIRAWSAACADGREVWSLAMLLDEVAGAADPPVPFRVFASDISPACVAEAERARYTDEALGPVPLRDVGRYFERDRAVNTVRAALREHVDFSVYDLLDLYSSSPPASIYGDFDLVLCCNVLFYHSSEAREAVVAKVRRALAPRGFLVTGAVERTIVQQAGGFEAFSPEAAVFRRRR